MRLSSIFLRLSAFLAAACLAVIAAWFSARLIEDASIVAVQGELDRDGLTWSTVDANGLQVFLAGNAPTEAVRFQAVSAAGRVVDAARIIDQMTVEEDAGLAPPRFSVEILRNDAGLSLIGLIPAATDRQALVEQIKRKVGADVPVSDFLETADFEAPPGWSSALQFAVTALRELPRSKISVEAGRLTVRAMVGSREEKRKLETDLMRRKPEDVRVALDLSAPRPVITPFTLRFVIEDGRARFDGCSADSDEAVRRIQVAATAAGLEGRVDCRIGLGVPSRRWAEAADLSIRALARLGGASVTMTDTDISLIAPEGTDQQVFDTVIGELENKLPPVFALTAVLPEPPESSDAGPAEFAATLDKEGKVRLTGRIGSEISRKTVQSFAEAQFGTGSVEMAARIDESLPQAWSVRVLAGVVALGQLANGSVRVTPDNIEVRGDTGNPNAGSDIAGLLSERLGEGQEFDIKVTYRERLDPTLNIPTPENCVRGITEIIGDRKITFEPGSAQIDAATRDLMDEIAELLKTCGQIQLEIQGHTDSQGRESMNLELSQQRADAVLNELRKRRVLTASYVARGYGEANPIADNGTEAGREANRRIEFKLLSPDPVEADTQSSLDSEPQSGQESSGEAAQENDG